MGEDRLGLRRPLRRGGLGRRFAGAGHEMDDAVAAALQFGEETRQHRRSLGLDVMQEDDTLAGLLDAPEKEFALGVRRHPVPVRGPDVGGEHADPARLEPVDQGPGVGEARKAEERHARRAVRRRGDAGRSFVGRDAGEDVAPRGLVRQAAQGRGGMGEGMMADRVAGGDLAPHQRRMGGGIAPDQEEGRLDALAGEGVENGRRRRRERPVVEGQHDLVVGQDERARIGLEADGEAAFGADRRDARGAERSGLGAGSRCRPAPRRRPACRRRVASG